MDILESLKEKACSVSLAAKTKKECLLELARLITSAEEKLHLETVLSVLEKREDQGSTGLDSGIAIPHARLANIKKFTVGIAIAKRGIDFDSLDGKKTYVFFTIVGPENQPQEYLKLLALIARVAKNQRVLKEMRNAPSSLSLREMFLQNLPVSPTTKSPKGRYKLLTIVLYEQRYLDDITQLFIERGIRGASVQESTGLRDLASRAPLFADFFNFLKGREEQSKTINAIVPESEIDSLVQGVEEIMGDLDTHSGAMIYSVDLSFTKGSLEVP